MFSRPVQRKLIITSASREVGALSNPSVAMMQLYIRIGQEIQQISLMYTIYSSSSCISGQARRYSRFLSVYCILQFQLYIRVLEKIQQISLCILYTLVLAVYQGIGEDIADFSLYTVYSSSSCISGQDRRYSRFLSVYYILQFQLYIRVGQEIQEISLCILYTLVQVYIRVGQEIQQISLCILYTLVLGVYQGRIGVQQISLCIIYN